MAVVALLLIPGAAVGCSSTNARNSTRRPWRACRGWARLVGPILAIPATVSDETHREVQRDCDYVLPDSLHQVAAHRAGRTSQLRGTKCVYLANIRAVARFDVAARVAAMTAAQTGVTLHLERARFMFPTSSTQRRA